MKSYSVFASFSITEFFFNLLILNLFFVEEKSTQKSCTKTNTDD